MAQDDNDDDETEFKVTRINQAQVARIFGKTPRTIGRWTTQGFLERGSDGKYDRETIETLANSKNNFEEEETNLQTEVHMVALSELANSNRQALDHNERLLQLLEKPITQALNAVTQINANLMTRLEKKEANEILMMETFGDILMKKTEQENLRAESLAKIEGLKNIVSQLGMVVPTLVQQMVGKRDVAKAFEAMSDEEKFAIFELTKEMNPAARKMFTKALYDLGIDEPKEQLKAENDK
jgi:uncharacterized protein YqeY